MTAADRNTTADAPTPRTVFNRWWRTPLERHHGTPAESFFAALDAAGYVVVDHDAMKAAAMADLSELERQVDSLTAERDAAVARADAAEAAIRVHHEAIWSEWSQTSRSIPPPADVALWAHVDIDPAARFAAERDRGTDR